MSVLDKVVVIAGFGFLAMMLWIAYAVIAFALRYQRDLKTLAIALGRPPTVAEAASYDHSVPSAVVRRR